MKTYVINKCQKQNYDEGRIDTKASLARAFGHFARHFSRSRPDRVA